MNALVGKKAYLVSRPLNVSVFDKLVSHNFIVIADGLDDENPLVISFGKLEDGTMGVLTGVDGALISDFSKGTFEADSAFWSTVKSENVTRIFAGAAVVLSEASRVRSTVTYSAAAERVPFLLRVMIPGGVDVFDYALGATSVNSNSAASAVASRAQRSSVRIPDQGRGSPGAGNARLVDARSRSPRPGTMRQMLRLAVGWSPPSK